MNAELANGQENSHFFNLLLLYLYRCSNSSRKQLGPERSGCGYGDDSNRNVVLCAENHLSLTCKSTANVLTRFDEKLSAVLAGIIVGPVLLIPLVRIFGAMSCSFWSMAALAVTSIWSALSNGPSNYTSFVASRAVAGIFASNAQVLATGIIVDIFPLHQRGKAFAIYSTIYMCGTVGGPTFAGFIVQRLDWPVCFWWTVGACGLSAILIFVTGDHTVWDRGHQRPDNWARNKDPQSTWLKRRMDLFFPGTQVVAPVEWPLIVRLRQPHGPHPALPSQAIYFLWHSELTSISQRKSFLAMPRIAFSPVTILTGVYSLISFGWFVMAGVQAPILLQEPFDPPISLGYGFDPQETSYWYFSAWIGAILAVGYGLLVNDWLPLWFYKRNNSVWQPEYRLQTAWLPGLILGPVGCGLFSASVFYHLHVGVLALGECLIVFAAVASVPPGMNYLVEVFKLYNQEVGAVMNVYRIIFTIPLQFFYAPWVARIGVNWVWCTAAFLSLFAFGLVVILMVFGPRIRKWNLLDDKIHD